MQDKKKKKKKEFASRKFPSKGRKDKNSERHNTRNKMVAGFDKIVTGTANCLSSRRCFPTTLLFMHFSPHAPWKSVYVERNRTAFRNFKESLNCLVLLRSFKRGARARALPPPPPQESFRSKVEPLEPQPVQHTDCNPPIGLERLTRQSVNCTKDEFGRGDVDLSRHSMQSG